MTKREILNVVFDGVKLTPKQERKILSTPKELLIRWYCEFYTVKNNPNMLKHSLRDWQNYVAYMLGGMF